MNFSRFMKFVDLTKSPNDKELIQNAVNDYLSFQKKFQDMESEAIIYRISCKDKSKPECYVGHTMKPITTRTYHHMKTCENQKYKYHNKSLYRFIRSNGGFSNFDIQVLENGLMSKSQARIREQYWIENYNPCLNKIDSCQK